ncbi:hypothetical protein AVEN_188134-1 [Araneus ventricosus]|uniref:Uncharacterized protein n=1 Tax=Araneus ventricosus TaxID=182803 RepID=A0A4Y2TT87_ARAVE|nr:hypothetical protein AVEN_188134-1 [Araneus ventricosus]
MSIKHTVLIKSEQEGLSTNRTGDADVTTVMDTASKVKQLFSFFLSSANENENFLFLPIQLLPFGFSANGRPRTFFCFAYQYGRGEALGNNVWLRTVFVQKYSSPTCNSAEAAILEATVLRPTFSRFGPISSIWALRNANCSGVISVAN